MEKKMLAGDDGNGGKRKRNKWKSIYDGKILSV